jgi:site-specific recombinase XerC
MAGGDPDRRRRSSRSDRLGSAVGVAIVAATAIWTSNSPNLQVRLLGKGRKERLCPLWPPTAQLLRTWCAERQLDLSSDTVLFLPTEAAL